MPDHWWRINNRPDIDPATGRYRESAPKPGKTGSASYLENSLQRIAVYADRPYTRDRTRVAQMLLDHGRCLKDCQREVLEAYCRR